jgi:amino acid transporter
MSDKKVVTKSGLTADEYGQLPGNSLGLFQTSASTLANIAPALSVFLTVPFLVANMGTAAPWIFILAAVAILCVGMSLSEFTKRVPSAGGFISFITRAGETRSRSTGTFLGSLSFYLLLLAYPVSISSLATFFGSWMANHYGWSPASWVWVSIVALAFAIPFLLRGTGLSVKIAFGLFILEAVVLVVLGIIVFARSGSQMAAPFHSVNGLGFKGMTGLAFSFAVFGFVGWENSGPLGEEAKDPKRTIPRTIVISVLVCLVVFFVATYALVVGFAHIYGANHGINILSTYADPSPFATLTQHFAPWLNFLLFIVGLSSALGGIIAASLPATRYIYHGARAGLLPRAVAKVSPKTGVPYVAMLIYVGATTLVTIVLDLILHNATTISGDEAGISTVPILIVYTLTSLLLPVFIMKRDRANFNPIRHIVIPYIGAIVMGYGVWESIKPGQSFPGNTYIIYVGIYIALGVIGALIAMPRSQSVGEKLARGLETQ